MGGILKWLAKTEDGVAPLTPQIDDDEYGVDGPAVLPAHVEEFLALKSAVDA